MLKTLRDVVICLESMNVWPLLPHTQELHEIVALLNDEGGLKVMFQTLDLMTPRKKSLGHARIPLVAARLAVAESRRRTAEGDGHRAELSRLRIKVCRLERELSDVRAAIDDL